METLDAIGQRYRTLPSDVLGETNPFKAFSINVHAASKGAKREQLEVAKHKAREMSKRGRRNSRR
jgi:hypothetical protein